MAAAVTDKLIISTDALLIVDVLPFMLQPRVCVFLQ